MNCRARPTPSSESNDVIDEMRKIAGTMWTPEIDAMLIEDIQRLVSRVSSGPAIIVLCAFTYHCTPEEIEERLKVIRIQTAQRLTDKWLAFQRTRFGEILYPVSQTGSGALQNKKQQLLRSFIKSALNRRW